MTERPSGGRRIGRRKTDVLDAACEVVADRGVDATRFTDVTAVTGVGASTLQYWFGSREDMLIAVFRHAADKDLADVNEHLADEHDPWRQLVFLAGFLTGRDNEKDDVGWRLWVEWWRWALRDDEVRAEVLHDYTRWRELIAKSVAAGITLRKFTTDNAPLDVAHQILAFFDGLALPVALGDPTISPQQAHRLLVDAVARLVGYQQG
ncbi:TetR/AcrR family transcriptional regulator [Microtetraspora malaysiensis]|uniref:TetR/AcrR family transcriptional regulator n=1 Tax=Microtetraspora malaysiensis TaxID=161358 RepID=UPI003D94BAC0